MKRKIGVFVMSKHIVSHFLKSDWFVFLFFSMGITVVWQCQSFETIFLLILFFFLLFRMQIIIISPYHTSSWCFLCINWPFSCQSVLFCSALFYFQPSNFNQRNHNERELALERKLSIILMRAHPPSLLSLSLFISYTL